MDGVMHDDGGEDGTTVDDSCEKDVESVEWVVSEEVDLRRDEMS